jgi:acyl-CoA thioester hydrolase
MNGRHVRPDLARIVLWVPIEVRYGDFDVQGHVNNVRYFTYFEQARVEFFSQLRAREEAAPTAGAALGPEDIPFVVVRAEAVYRRPITAFAPVVVGLDCARLTHTSMDLRYAVCDQPGGTLYASGATTITSVDQQSGRPRALPGWARQGAEALLGPVGDGAAGTSGQPA